MAASFECRRLDLISVLELEASRPAIVIEPQSINEAIEARRMECEVATLGEHAGREYAYSLVTRLCFLADRPCDEDGTPVAAS